MNIEVGQMVNVRAKMSSLDGRRVRVLRHDIDLSAYALEGNPSLHGAETLEPCLGWVAYTASRPPRVGDVVRCENGNKCCTERVDTITKDSLRHVGGPFSPGHSHWTGCPSPTCTREEPHDVTACAAASQTEYVNRVSDSLKAMCPDPRDHLGADQVIAYANAMRDAINEGMAKHLAGNPPAAKPDAATLARALFRERMHKQICRRAECPSSHDIDGTPIAAYLRVEAIMWERTEPHIRRECEVFAARIVKAWP